MATVDDRDSLMRVLRDDRLLYPGIDEKMAGQQDVPDLAGLVGRSWQAKERRMSHGKKIGKFKVTTVLAEYDLDVRLDMERDLFVILVPGGPGEEIDPNRLRVHQELFEAPTLAEAKAAAKSFLISRDVTEFVDVIEYTWRGLEEHSGFGGDTKSISLDFRVARVSVARNKFDEPKLEIPVDIDESGHIAVAEAFGKPCRPESHNMYHSESVLFTIDRWRKFCAIKDGLTSLGKMLANLLGPDGNEVGAKLDAIGANPLLLAGLAAAGEQEAHALAEPRRSSTKGKARS